MKTLLDSWQSWGVLSSILFFCVILVHLVPIPTEEKLFPIPDVISIWAAFIMAIIYFIIGLQTFLEQKKNKKRNDA
jgi:cadmium resistance protein CadD (predicted permease)